MSLVARIALGIAVLAVLAVGGVIFFVLPKLGGSPGEETPITTAAAPASPTAPESSSANSTPAPAPAPVQTAEAPPPAPAPAAPPATPPAAPPAPPPPAPSPASETPAPVAANAVPPTPAPPEPSPAPPAATGQGAPIPLTPAASEPASAPLNPGPANPAPAVAAAPFNPAEPGADNISDRIGRTMTMAGTADARAAPLAAAPVLTRLEAGTPVMVVGVLAGHLWLEVQLADQRTAYVPAAALPGAVSSAPAMTASAPPPAPEPARMPSPGGGTPVGPAPAPAEAPALLNASEDLTTTGPTPVYGGPAADGPVLRTLRAGTAVHLVAKTADGKWGWMQTPGGEQSFVQMSLLSAAPALPESISGRATVVNTGTLIVNGQKVQLFGLRGEGGVYAEQMRSQLESQGGLVTCHRQDTQYICVLPGGVDLGRMVLYNGAARPAPNASVDYQQQTAVARAAGRGVWGR